MDNLYFSEKVKAFKTETFPINILIKIEINFESKL
jgi:hypothetical protein